MSFLIGAFVGAFVASLVWVTSLYRRKPPRMAGMMTPEEEGRWVKAWRDLENVDAV